MPWNGNEGKRMAGVLHSEKSAGFHSSGLPIKNDSPHSENWLRRAKGSLLKIISPMNPLNLLNHREAVCLIQTSSCGTIERIERRRMEMNGVLIFSTTN